MAGSSPADCTATPAELAWAGVNSIEPELLEGLDHHTRFPGTQHGKGRSGTEETRLFCDGAVLSWQLLRHSFSQFMKSGGKSCLPVTSMCLPVCLHMRLVLLPFPKRNYY